MRFLVLILFSGVLFVIPALIGVYVYRDAAQRRMNAALWTLVAVIAPMFIGVIIYLIVRGNYSDLTCPSCAAHVAEQYVVCPKCGIKLRASCASCGFPIESDWTVCPKCASSLPEHGMGYTAPTRKKDTALGKILLIAVALPVLLIVLLFVFGITSFNGAVSSYSMNTIQMTTEDYADRPEINAWLDSCDENSEKTYALCYKTERNGQKATHYLVYRPSENVIDTFNVTNASGLFGPRVEVRIFEGGDPAEAELKLTCISAYSDKHMGLQVFVNGIKTDCEVTEVNYALAPFEIVSENTSKTIQPAESTPIPQAAQDSPLRSE